MMTAEAATSQEERDGWIALNLAPEIGGAKLRALKDRFGSSQRVLQASHSAIQSVPGIGEVSAEALSKVSLELGRREREKASSMGIRILLWEDAEFPEPLRHIDASPGLLYVRGSMEALGKNLTRAVAVVGTRKATERGLATARSFARGLAEKGATVISGLALGIDGEAHAGSLDAGGLTVAVMAHGLAMVHPSSHQALFERIIAQRGAAVSEYPLFMPPNKKTFPARNRIISGLSRAVLVVEADEGSGALITLDHALRQDRSGFAIPGRLEDLRSRGCLLAIRDQRAVAALEPRDILADLERRAMPRGEARAMAAVLSGDDQQVFEALRDGSLTVDALVTRTGISVPRLFPVLLRLEMDGLIRSLPGQAYAHRS